MPEILIVYHTQTGNTEGLARAAASGVEAVEGFSARLKRAADAGLDDLVQCPGLVIATPCNFGYMAGMIKDFFDRTYEAARGRREVFKKPTVLLISCGNDGSGAQSSVERIMVGMQLRMVQEPLVVTGPPDEAALAKARELGMALAAGIEAGIF